MQPSVFLFVLFFFVVDAAIEEVWDQQPPLPDTVLMNQHQPTDKKNPALFPESTQLRKQNDIHHKFLDVNGSSHQFEFKDCGNEFSIIRFLELAVLPDPIVIPGQIQLSFKIQFKETIDDELRATVKLTRKMGGFPIRIPCIDKVGSCVYKNLCENLRLLQKCPRPFVEHGINCSCPLNKGLMSLPLSNFSIAINYIPSGEFAFHVLLHHKKAFAGCLRVKLTIK